MISRPITYFGQSATLICDARCSKAWGMSRPHVQLSDDPDDIMWLADGELGEAPVDPGTYEGSDAKPTSGDERLNKWCARSCERSDIARPLEHFDLPDFSTRTRNMPAPDPADS